MLFDQNILDSLALAASCKIIFRGRGSIQSSDSSCAFAGRDLTMVNIARSRFWSLVPTCLALRSVTTTVVPHNCRWLTSHGNCVSPNTSALTCMSAPAYHPYIQYWWLPIRGSRCSLFRKWPTGGAVGTQVLRDASRRCCPLTTSTRTTPTAHIAYTPLASIASMEE